MKELNLRTNQIVNRRVEYISKRSISNFNTILRSNKNYSVKLYHNSSYKVNKKKIYINNSTEQTVREIKYHDDSRIIEQQKKSQKTLEGENSLVEQIIYIYGMFNYVERKVILYQVEPNTLFENSILYNYSNGLLTEVVKVYNTRIGVPNKDKIETYTYDQYENILKYERANWIYQYQYKYDDKKSWIERRTTLAKSHGIGKLKKIEKRKIKYY